MAFIQIPKLVCYVAYKDSSVSDTVCPFSWKGWSAKNSDKKRDTCGAEEMSRSPVKCITLLSLGSFDTIRNNSLLSL